MGIRDFFLSWQTIAVCSVLLVWLGIEFFLFSQFYSLPSPVYGGDVYYHFSVVNHIYNGGSPLMSSQFLGEYAHYPWIFHLLVVVFAKISGLSALSADIYAPLFTTLFSGIISYLLGLHVFESKTFGLLFAMYWVTLQIPHAAPSPFGQLVIFPLFILAVSTATSLPSLPKRVFAGIALGLTGLSQVALWIAAFIYLGLLMVWRVIEQHVRYDNSSFQLIRINDVFDSIKQQVLWVLPILLIGLPIGMLFWAPAFFVYHGVTPNRWADYVAAGDTLTFGAVWDMVEYLFFNLRMWVNLPFSLLALAGLFFSLTRMRRFHVPFLVFVTAAIGFFHPLLTLPLFKTSIGYYAFGYVFDLAQPLLFVMAIYIIYRSLSSANLKSICFCVAALLVVAHAYGIYGMYDSDQWTRVGRQENPMFVLASEIIDTVPNTAVFLVTHEETGFAFNALTGKKVVLARRTHASPFVDINKRVADTAVMLYGNNSNTVVGLLQNYSVQYLYEDFYSYQQQALCDSYFGRLNQTGGGDASFACLRTTLQYASYLGDNGISFVKVHARLDPASSVAPQFDLLAIRPGNYTWVATHGNLIRQAGTPPQIIQKWVELETRSTIT